MPSIPGRFAGLCRPSRYKIMWGGRGSAKSVSAAMVLVALTYTQKLKVLCTREYQSSIGDSVHTELVAAIERLELGSYFHVTQRGITSWCGSDFLFDGLHHNADQIKSKSGIDICWCEEAHSTTADSLKYLIPTIRRDPPFGPSYGPQFGPAGTGSEIWFTLNQHDDTDAVFDQFIAKRRPNSWVRSATWEHNPYFPGVLDEERRYMLEMDPEAYEWVWGTACRKLGSSIVLKGRYVVDEFDSLTDDDIRSGIEYRHGLDFGYANDPSALLRSFIRGDDLYIDQEVYQHGVEIADPDPERTWLKFMERISTTRAGWPIKADCSRPETISFLRGLGFNVSAAEKWPGSVEDGVTHLKGFRKIHIHQRCKNTAREARLWSYKVDRMTGDVMPVLAPKHDHTWDAERYALDGLIQNRGGLGVWAKLGAMQ